MSSKFSCAILLALCVCVSISFVSAQDEIGPYANPWEKIIVGKKIIEVGPVSDPVTEFATQTLKNQGFVVRVINDKTAVTMDLRPSRINIWVDSNNIATAVTKG